MIERNKFTTFSGKKFIPEEIKLEDITPEDIARGLSNQCRFSGQIPVFYSVAEHSIEVYRKAIDYLWSKYNSLSSTFENLTEDQLRENKNLLLYALLHDASEAYISDIPTPFKDMLPDYKQLESELMEVIFTRFGVKANADDEKLIKQFDQEAFEEEYTRFHAGCAYYSYPSPDYFAHYLKLLNKLLAL